MLSVQRKKQIGDTLAGLLHFDTATEALASSYIYRLHCWGRETWSPSLRLSQVGRMANSSPSLQLPQCAHAPGDEVNPYRCVLTTSPRVVPRSPQSAPSTRINLASHHELQSGARYPRAQNADSCTQACHQSLRIFSRRMRQTRKKDRSCLPIRMSHA